MADGIGLAEALLGLDGFRVLDVSETADELTIRIETTVEVVGCATCVTRGQSLPPGGHRGDGGVVLGSRRA